MKAEHHALVSVPVAAGIWYFTGNFWYFLMAIFLGVLVDVDHVFEYVREEGKFDFKDMFVKSYKGDFRKMYLFFHCFEFVPVVYIYAFFTGNYEFATAFSVAYLSHMIPDQFANNTKPLGYFFIYRLLIKFEMRKIFDVPKEGIHRL